MTAGTVIGVVKYPDFLLLVLDGMGEDKGKEVSVAVGLLRIDTKQPPSISLGDTMWSQGRVFYWTPRSEVPSGSRTNPDGSYRYDIPLKWVTR